MKRIAIVIKSLMLTVFLCLVSFTSANSQNCSATLSVEKDRNARSAYEDEGAIFNMVLTNTSSRQTTYTISTKSLEASCANDNYRTSAPNVSLNVSVRNRNNASVANNSLTLSAGETREFQIYVSVPAQTPLNTWSCIEVLAQGTDCARPATSTTLRVFVPEPSDG
ncbi:MAG: hypothetical protein CL526_04445 [Aequorivita sp.]|nr:hypothetical protein [Aequorivita sp.]|tara:strand:- start:5617 stop:6114 length:498 start_codon:yes stop_codon:yes gene_type:complete